jgi:23S rRNA pseudouridine2605 synthase
MEQRLQKLLAAAGIASRRSCEALIAAGRVSVNGQPVTELGTKADPDRDEIQVDGKPVDFAVEPIHIVLNKPLGYVSTVSDPHAKHTVMDLVRGMPGRLYPVGRLDADSAGLLLLTNDGAFTERLTHPSHQVPKTYRVLARGEVPEWAAADLRRGILLEDGMTAPAEVEWVDYDRANNASIIDITIHEGRNRQVRRMFEAVGYPVLALTRTRVGPILLKGLAPGTWRKLHPSEVKALLDVADSTPLSLPQKPADAGGEFEDQPVRPATGRGAREPRDRKPPDRPRTPRHEPKPSTQPGRVDDHIRTAAKELTERLRGSGREDSPESPAKKQNAHPPSTGKQQRRKPRP